MGDLSATSGRTQRINYSGTHDFTGATVIGLSGGGVSGLTAGRVPFAATATTVVDDAALYWDNTNKRLGINAGTNPITQLEVRAIAPKAFGSVATGTTPYAVFVYGRYAYVCNQDDNTLQIFDVSVPSAPVSLSTVATGAQPRSIIVQGRYAYVANFNANTVQVIDVTNPAVPSVVGSVGTDSGPRSIQVVGAYAFIVNTNSATLQVIDISKPSAPVVVGSVATVADPFHFVIEGRYGFMTGYTSSKLQSFDLADPTAPAAVSNIATANTNPRFVYVQGRYAYVPTTGGADVEIYDISNPASMVLAGSIVCATTGPRGIVVQGRAAYVTTNDGYVEAFDVSNPAAPSAIGTLNIGGTPLDIHIQGRFLYTVTVSTNLLKVIDIGGAYVSQVEVGGLEATDLIVKHWFQGVDGSFSGGLQIGQSFCCSGNAAVGGDLRMIGSVNHASALVFKIGGTERGRFTTTGMTVTGTFTPSGAFLMPDGSAASPTLAFAAVPSTGWYRSSGVSMSFATGGAECLRFGVAELTFKADNMILDTAGPGDTGVIRNATGTAAAPSYSFHAQSGLGMYRSASSTLGFACNGVLSLSISTSAMTFSDAINIIFNTSTGTKIGTATSQKIGFWNVAPIIQPAGADQAAMTDSTTGTVGTTLSDVGAVFSQSAINTNFASLNNLVASIRTALVNSGLIKGAA